VIFFLLTFICEWLAYPDVEIREVTPDWEFMVIACDGIWDVLTNEVSLWQYLSFQSMPSLKRVTWRYHYPIPFISSETFAWFKLSCMKLKEKTLWYGKMKNLSHCCSYLND
jgi:hypothetical protein